MGRVALRGIRAHLVRFLLSLLAVALGVAFVAGTFSLRTMLAGTFDGIVDSASPADAYVRAGSDSGTDIMLEPGTAATRPDIPVSLRDDIAATDGIAHAIPELQGGIVLVGADGTAVQSGGAPSMALLYVSDDPSLTVVAGRPPAAADEIAVESATLKSSGLAVGDTTTAVLDGQITHVTVVGEVDLGAPMAGATIVLVDEATGMALFAPDGKVADIAVYGEPGLSEQEVVDRLGPVVDQAAADGVTLERLTGDALRTENKDSIHEMLGFITTFLLVFAAIALFVGAFIISNTFQMSVRQRMREFALLRAVGASPTQVFASILIQAAVVGLIGSVVGIAGGLGLVQLLKVGLESMGMSLTGDIPVDASTILVSLLVGTLVSVVAAAIPARRAALVPPVEAMRDDVAVPERSMRVRVIIGTVLAGLGAAGVLTAVLRPEADAAQNALAFGAVGVVLGMLVLAPSLARWTIGVLAWPFVTALRPIGRLARGNVVRNPRRTANTAGALMIGMALVGAATVIASSTQASVGSIVEKEANADLVLQSATGMVPPGAIDDVRSVPDVAVVDPLAFSAMTVTADGEVSDGATTYVAGLGDGVFGRTLEVETVDGDLASISAGEAAVQKSKAEDEGWHVGDRITLATGGVSRDLTIGVIFSANALGSPVVVGQATLDELVPPAEQAIDTVFLQGAPGTDLDALHAGVAAAVAPYVVVSVMDSDEFVSSLADQVNQVLVILYALLGLSIVIAVLGIVNTLALSVIERTREIGLLRAVGLGRLQLAGTVTIESVLTAVFGTVVGLAVGVALASALPRVFADDGLSTLVVPWGSLVGMLVLAVVVGVLAAVWPGTRAARMPVLDAVSYE
ncbi:ABC transporter permease [Cellulomonas hominis]